VLVFFLVSVVAGILGFTGLSAASAEIGRIPFYIFVVIFLVLPLVSTRPAAAGALAACDSRTTR